MQDSIEDYLQILKNTKPEPENKKDVLIKPQIKKECDSKAMQIIQFAIEGRLRSQALFRCLPFITQSHYQDIVEERSITKLCGYPLCAKQIPDMPRKQFHIATKSNTIYDITERKNYCSNYCYNASVHIKRQIDNSPLWLRAHDKLPQFTLFNKQESVSPGEKVDQGVAKPNHDHHFTSVFDFTQVSLDEAEENELSAQDAEKQPKTAKKPKKYQKNSMVTITENDEDQIEPKRPEPAETKDKLQQILDNLAQKKRPVKRTALTDPKPLQKPAKSAENKPNCMGQAMEKHVLKCFKEWITLETFVFLYGEDRLKAQLETDTLREYLDGLKSAGLQVEQETRYLDICRKLRLKELAEEKQDKRLVGNTALHPVPDYQQLRQEGEEMDLRVKSFYSGEVLVKEKTEKVDKTPDEEEGAPAVLPLADGNSQTMLRRRIYMNALQKTMNALLERCGVLGNPILPDIQQLVKTFKLKADNIVFKQQTWNIIAIILLKILSIKDQTVAEIISSERFQESLNFCFLPIGINVDFIDKIIHLVIYPDEFVRNCITCN